MSFLFFPRSAALGAMAGAVTGPDVTGVPGGAARRWLGSLSPGHPFVRALQAAALALALHSLKLARAVSLLPLLWAVATAVPLLVIAVYAIAGSPSTIKGANGEGQLVAGAQPILLAVWLVMNLPVQLLAA